MPLVFSGQVVTQVSVFKLPDWHFQTLVSTVQFGMLVQPDADNFTQLNRP